MMNIRWANATSPFTAVFCIGLIASIMAAEPPFALWWPSGRVAAADLGGDFFGKQVRPLLEQACVRCHGAETDSGGLRLDLRSRVLRGGDSGPPVVPHDPMNSLLISAVRRVGDLKMPPDDPLTTAQVKLLERWVQQGAPWPDEQSQDVARDATPHWAFAPLARPPVPSASEVRGARTPIDAFVIEKLSAQHLSPAPAADRRTLIRRVTFDLLGLPPTITEVDAFVLDDGALAYERLVDRLLSSPRYGEAWGRHWLDVARYSDSKGYVYAREERFWVHAWVYRDWVVDAFNSDLPYDRFLLLQIAADQVETNRSDLAAMGFLTLGRRFLGVTHDIIDDRIDVVTRGTMGLTVACARCHNHKYDPIPTRDYYSLYGVFQNSVEQLVSLGDVAEPDSDFATGLQERVTKLQTKMSERRAEAAGRVRTRISDYLTAQLELEKYPEEGFDQILTADDLMPAVVRRWRDYLNRAAGRNDAVFVAWRRFRSIAKERFRDDVGAACQSLQSMSPAQVDPRVAALFVEPPQDLTDVADRYAKFFAGFDRQYRRREDVKRPAEDPISQVLYGPQAPCEVPDEPIVSTESFFPTQQCEELWKLSGEVDRWLIKSPNSPAHALILADRNFVKDARVLVRGNASTPGEQVPRQFLEVIVGSDRQPFERGSGRLELAHAIVDPANPLTSRVAVNRIWQHHFGVGLVTSPSDFGRRAAPPSHPELLDWLTHRFIESGWSTKKLHRLILLSATYQQASFRSTDSVQLERQQQQDPENRLLWRMNTRRLTFEQLRDAGLAVAERLNLQMGGKPVELFDASHRRTLYARIDRQFLPTVLRVFDFANPDLHIPQRSETTVPQQALFFMNHPFVLELSQQLVRRCREEDTVAPHSECVTRLYRAVYQRNPTNDELQAALELVDPATSQSADEDLLDPWEQLAQVLLSSNEFLFVD